MSGFSASFADVLGGLRDLVFEGSSADINLESQRSRRTAAECAEMSKISSEPWHSLREQCPTIYRLDGPGLGAPRNASVTRLGAVLRHAASIALRRVSLSAAFRWTLVAPRRPQTPFTGTNTSG